MVSGFIQVVVTAADSAMLGRYSTNALASAALAVPVYLVATAVVISCTTGAQVLSARHLGAGRNRAVGEVSDVSVAGAVAIGAILALALLALAGPLSSALAADEVIAAGAATYLGIVGLALPFFAAMVVLRATYAGLGDTKVGMRVAFFVMAVNVPASLALIFGLDLGVAGAALGTVTATAFGSVLMVLHGFRRHRETHRLFHRENLAAWRNVAPEVWRIGWPEAAMGGLAYASAVVVIGIVAGLGTAPLAAARLVDAVVMILWVAIFSTSTGVSILCGQSLGARDIAGVESYRRAGLALMLMLGGVILLPALLAPHTLFGLFTPDERVVGEAARAGYMLLAVAPFMTVGMPLAGVLRAAGDTRSILLASTIADFAVRLPLAWALIWPLGLGLSGSYLAFAAYWLVRTAVTTARHARGRWKEVAE